MHKRNTVKVKCIANTGKDLSEKSIESGEHRGVKFDVDIGKVYVVYSMFIFRGALDYLLSEESTDVPFWYPAELFEVVDSLLSLEWHFTFIGYGENHESKKSLAAIWGYKEMIFDSKHYIDLTEREPEALDIFFKRKREMDEYEELSKFMYKK